MKNDDMLLKALEEFRSKYPNSTSGDLQTFIIGWIEGSKVSNERLCEFGIWVQDNYSQNRYAHDNKTMLPKGQMRKDFTNDIYSISQIVEEFNRLHA